MAETAQLFKTQMSQPRPYSFAWHMQKPPERLEAMFRRYLRKCETLTPNVRKSLQTVFERMTLEAAQQIDRDLCRLLPTYGQFVRVSPSLMADLGKLAEDAAQKARDLEQDKSHSPEWRQGLLEAALTIQRSNMRKAWGSEEREG